VVLVVDRAAAAEAVNLPLFFRLNGPQVQAQFDARSRRYQDVPIESQVGTAGPPLSRTLIVTQTDGRVGIRRVDERVRQMAGCEAFVGKRVVGDLDYPRRFVKVNQPGTSSAPLHRPAINDKLPNRSLEKSCPPDPQTPTHNFSDAT